MATAWILPALAALAIGAGRKAQQFHTNPDRVLLGEDRRMYGSWVENFLLFRFDFDADIPSVDDRLRKWLVKLLNDPKHVIRCRAHATEARYFYDTTPTSTLVERTLLRTDDFDDRRLRGLVANKDVSFLIAYNDRTLGFLANHQFIDGMGAVRILNTLFDDDVRSVQLPKFRYVPVLTDLALVRHLPHLARKTRRELAYAPSWKVSDDAIIMHRRESLETFKARKTSLNVSFVSLMTATALRSIFDASDAKRLSVGVLAAFESNARFNNYGLITTTIERPSARESERVFVTSIDRELRRRKSMALTTFLVGNVYNADAISYGGVDVLISGMPISIGSDKRAKALRIGQIARLDTARVYHRFSATPVYFLHLSDDRSIHYTMTLRSPDVRANVLRETGGWV